jgi:hypothetical protein
MDSEELGEHMLKLVKGLLDTSFDYADQTIGQDDPTEYANFMLNLAGAFAANCAAMAIDLNSVFNWQQAIKTLLTRIEKQIISNLTEIDSKYKQ